MASNQYVNKVVFGANTLIDISDTTATADKILQGYGAYGANGAWMDGTAVAGSGSAVSVVDTLDANGGTIRTITSVSLAGDTVAADKLLSGYTAHNALGQAITGTYVPPSSGSSVESNKTVSPSESQQIVTPSTGYDALAQVTVNAISSTYVGSGINQKAAATITPTKSTQTIASGTYLTGTQTIAAIPAAYQDVTGVTAAAGDVVSGKSIVDSSGNTVNGSLVIQHYYTGSGTPSASTGVNGDIYLKTA